MREAVPLLRAQSRQAASCAFRVLRRFAVRSPHARPAIFDPPPEGSNAGITSTLLKRTTSRSREGLACLGSAP